MTFFQRHPASFLIAAFSMLLSHAAFAGTTLQINLGGDLLVGSDTVGILVVDRAGDGFLSPDHVSAEGTMLEVGEQVGLSDDVIVAVLKSSTDEFSIGAGFLNADDEDDSDSDSIDYDALQLSEGMPMIFYWFPGVTTTAAPLQAGGVFESFRATAPSNAPGSIQFMLPADSGVFDLAYLAVADGGSVSLTEPAGDGVYETGVVATDSTPLPGGGDSRVDPVTELPLIPGFTDIDWQSDAKGTYYGLILGLGGRVMGDIAVKVSKSGSLSVTITLDGKRLSYKGGLELPAATLTDAGVSRSKTGETDLILDLALLEDDSTAGYSLVGTLDDDGVELLITAAHNASKRGGPAVEESGNYTFALPAPGGIDQTILPAGDGVGTVSVSETGGIRALMTLGDGTRSSDKGYLSQDKTWDLYVPLYKKNGDGFIAGRVALRDVDNIADFDSPLHWKKGAETKPSAKSCYPAGFETSVNLVGSRFDTPRPGMPLLSQLVDVEDNAILMLEGGALDPVIDAKTLTWGTDNNVSFDGSADNEAIKIKPSTKNGSVNGTFTKTYVDGSSGDTVKQKVSFSGVALQKQGIIVGNFKGNDQLTGLLTIESFNVPSLTVHDGVGNPVGNTGVIDFGSIGIDGGLGERVVEIVNHGDGNLFVDGVPELDDPAFGLAAARMGFLTPGESARFRVRFDPDSESAFAGTLTIYSNDRINNPFVINLTGQGVAGSASDIESGDGRPVLVAVPLAPPVPSGFDPVVFDAANATGTFGGSIDAVGTVTQQVGYGSIKITGDTTSGTGVFSGSLKVGSDVGKVSGTVDANGSLSVAKFKGNLAAKYEVGQVAMVENGDGNFALAGTLVSLGAGDVVDFLFGHFTYHKKHNPTALEGRYTMVIPANEDLGAGYPSGDGIAFVTVAADAGVSASFVLADGEKVTVAGRLSDEDVWQVYQSWKAGTVGGRLQFREVPEISDFDGVLNWDRPANPKAKNFHEGFSIVAPAIGSLFVPPAAGTPLLESLPGGDDNAELRIAGHAHPIGGRLATWTDDNAISVTPADTSEKFKVKVSTKTGSISTTLKRSYDDNGVSRKETVKCSGVIFQKQDIVTGNWQAGGTAGYYGIGLPPSS